MVDLSEGQVSGFIAAGVFVIQFFLPLAVPAILVAFISDTHSLLTWSVLGRFLQASPWPTLLGADTAASRGVQKRVNLTSWFSTAALLTLAVASVVTPLGLYDSIEPEDSTEDTPFKYMKDASPFGYGTPPRPDAYFTRNCGTDRICPGASINESCHQVGRGENCTSELDVKIPGDFISPFRDGATSFSPSVSSIFDIQWRAYINHQGAQHDDWFVTPKFRQLSVLILEEDIQPVEGLIVDMETGGIGFRNHTIPETHYKYGSQWKEDILFIEPETQCVDLNFTVDYTLPEEFGGSEEFVDDFKLTDRGGFSGLRETPAPSRDPIVNGQANLNLRERATNAGWLNNFLTMAFYNATSPNMTDISRLDVTENDTFPLPAYRSNTTFRLDYDSITSNQLFGRYLNLTGSSGLNESRWSENPHNVTRDDFAFIMNQCAGSMFHTPANINTSVVGCGLLYGAAQPVDVGFSALVPSPKSRWSVPVYSCASAVKALVKEVSFTFNGTTLDDLKINVTRPKGYPDAESKPLWGVENLGDITISGGRPFWGILGPSSFQDNITYPSNISVVSQEHLYLPGYLDDASIFLAGDDPVTQRFGNNIPGSDFHNQALQTAYNIRLPGGGGQKEHADYSGQTSLALFAKWQKLSTTAEGAAKILNLVWTDVAANAVLGTKGWGLTSFSATADQQDKIRKRSTDGDSKPLVPVTVFKRRIRYEIPYAVPALVILTVVAILLAMLIILCSTGKARPERMRQLLKASSTGRVAGTFLFPGTVDSAASSKKWVRSVGQSAVTIRIRDAEIRAVDASEAEEDGKGDDFNDETPMVNLSPKTVPESRSQSECSGAISTQRAPQ